MAHTYDYAIIGSGLTGLSIAAALSRETKNIALIEASEFAGGANRQISFPTGMINNGLRFVPHTPLSEQALLFLESLLGMKVIAGHSEAAPITYEAGGFKTFLGFGDNPPAFYEELNYFTHAQRTELNLEPGQWTKLLFEKFKGDFFPRSYVTKFHQEGEKVTHITVNGSKTLHAQNYIFAGSPKDLAVLLPEEALPLRARTRLSKNTYWTALCLDLCHSQVISTTPAMHVLNGTTQDEIGPSAGRFLDPVEVNGVPLQVSQWVTFMETEETEDSEVVGLSLKKMKRQIKRAYPEAFEGLKLERIFIAPMIAGNGDLKLHANQTLPTLQNLWVASSPINIQKNLVGALLQAELVVSSLGFKVDASFLPVEVPEQVPAQGI